MGGQALTQVIGVAAVVGLVGDRHPGPGLRHPARWSACAPPTQEIDEGLDLSYHGERAFTPGS